MKLKLEVVSWSELEPGLLVRVSVSVVRSVRVGTSSLETETTFTGNLWLPVGDSNNASRRKLRRQKTRVA